MRSDELTELTELLQTASRTLGPEAPPDPRALIGRVRHRRQAVGLALAAALVLLAAAAVPALQHREDGAIDVAAGGAAAEVVPDPPPVDAAAELSAEPTTTTTPQEPTTPPAVTTAPTPSTASGPTTAPPAAAGPTVTTGAPKPPTVPTTPTTRGPGVPPELIAASGNAAAPRVLLRFSRPVVPGDGPNFDRPPSAPSPPTTQDTYMAAMQLVVHQSDSTCSNPQGNAHEYLAGVGTDTLTVDATSLVVGTTYISISPGFAKSADDGTAMVGVRCIPITVKG